MYCVFELYKFGTKAAIIQIFYHTLTHAHSDTHTCKSGFCFYFFLHHNGTMAI